jgi:flagellar hook-associated protein 3 FlgL
MRITQQHLQARALADLAMTQERIARTRAQISSGERIQDPSDDVMGAVAVLDRRAEVDRLAGFRDTTASAAQFTEATDSALQSVTDVLHRVHELVVKGATSSTSTAGRKAIAAEVRQLIASVKDTANARQGDQYLFSGTATTTAPYGTATDAYGGDAGAVLRTIGPGVSVQVNVLGSQVFGSGQTPAPGDGKLLDALRDVVDHLDADDVASLGTTDLKALDQNLDNLSGVRAVIGASAARIESADARLADLEDLATERLGDVEDTDYATAILELNAQSTAYQAALRSAAQITQPSLLDFLR